MIEKFVKYSISFIAYLIVFLGIYFVSIFLKSEFTILSVLLGLLGLFILYPALNAWRERLTYFIANSDEV
jgi:hypothetical protein